jgi:hypothetical protein
MTPKYLSACVADGTAGAALLCEIVNDHCELGSWPFHELAGVAA